MPVAFESKSYSSEPLVVLNNSVIQNSSKLGFSSDNFELLITDECIGFRNVLWEICKNNCQVEKYLVPEMMLYKSFDLVSKSVDIDSSITVL